MRRPLGAPLESRSCGKVIADDLGGWGSVPSTPSYGHGVAVVPEAWYASSRARGHPRNPPLARTGSARRDRRTGCANSSSAPRRRYRAASACATPVRVIVSARPQRGCAADLLGHDAGVVQ